LEVANCWRETMGLVLWTLNLLLDTDTPDLRRRAARQGEANEIGVGYLDATSLKH
jgi:hypothetical protein